jgi:hypothetical protein
MARKCQVISADAHPESPPERWVKHVPEECCKRAPRLIALPDYPGEVWVAEGENIMHTCQPNSDDHIADGFPGLDEAEINGPAVFCTPNDVIAASAEHLPIRMITR